MNNRIILVRHGESYGNLMNIIQGRTDKYGLTPKGINQIINASKIIKSYNPSMIISSPLKRAIQSSKILKNECNINNELIELNDFLKEIYFGDLEGVSRTYRNTQLKEKYNILKNTQYDYSIFNGESLELVKERALYIFNYIKSIERETIIVVSHGGFMRELMKFFANENIEKFDFHNGSTFLIDSFKIKQIN